MDLEEILQLDRYPFDYGAMGGELGSFCTEEVLMENKAHFALFLCYMDRFIDRCGFQIPTPKWNCYMEKRKRDSLCNSGEAGEFIDTKHKVMREIFQSVMLFCGWGIGRIRMQDAGQTPEIFPPDIISLREWEHIFSCMPGFGALEKQGFRDITVTVCWNRALYDYHVFVKENGEMIKKQFAKAQEVIAGILRKTADPLALGLDGAMSCYQDQKYIMGFFEANHSDETVSILDLDYNFMVQILILHMLLNYAENQFGYR